MDEHPTIRMKQMPKIPLLPWYGKDIQTAARKNVL